MEAPIVTALYMVDNWLARIGKKQSDLMPHNWKRLAENALFMMQLAGETADSLLGFVNMHRAPEQTVTLNQLRKMITSGDDGDLMALCTVAFMCKFEPQALFVSDLKAKLAESAKTEALRLVQDITFKSSIIGDIHSCPKCAFIHKEIVPAAKFCPQCGMSLATGVAPQANNVVNAVRIPVGDSQMPLLDRSCNSLEFSVRVWNCLQNTNIRFAGELVQKTESELLKIENFGRESLGVTKDALAELGLTLDMDVRGWKPPT